MITSHTTTVLLYFSVAGMCREYVFPLLLVVKFMEFSTVKRNPSTSQPTTPVVALQLKVAVDPSVALTDLGVISITEIRMILKVTVLCTVHNVHIQDLLQL